MEEDISILTLKMKRLDGWVERRRANARALAERFAGSEVLRVSVPEGTIYHSYYKFYAFVRPEMQSAI